MIETDDGFMVEVFTLYGIGMVILIGRLLTRLRMVGFKELRGDDYFAMAVMVFYTLDAALVHITYHDGTNMDYSQTEIDAMTQDQKDMVEFGSKMELFAWYSYVSLIWCLKGTMLCFFQRLTLGTWQARWIKYIAWACGASYIAIHITLAAGCRPYSDNWKVDPLPTPTCSAKQHVLITVAILNVLTDAALLSIPLPLLWKLKVPVRQKIVIAILLSSGIFVITAAILRVAFSAVPNPSMLTMNSWGIRETIVGVISVNVPVLRPLFRKEFWKPSNTQPTGSGQKSAGHYGMASMKPKSGRASKILDDNDSSDYIVGHKHDVMVETTIEVRSENDVEANSSQAASSEWRYDRGVETRAGV